MVSVRRPGGRHSGSSSGNGSTTLLTFRNSVIFFIVVQSIHLVFRGYKVVVQNGGNGSNNGSNNNILPPTAVRLGGDKHSESWRIQEQKNAAVKAAVKLPAPMIQIERIPEAHEEDPADHHSDHLPGDEFHTVPVAVVPVEVPVPVAVVPPKVPNDDHDPPDHHEAHLAATTKVLDPATTEIMTKHGSGPTKAGFVVDFLHDRQEPEFRKAVEDVENADKIAAGKNELVASLVGLKSVKPCEVYDKQDRTYHTQVTCRDADTPLIVYNPASFTRTVCGHVLEPGQAVQLHDPCHKPAQLFPHQESLPPVNGHDMPAIVILSSKAPVVPASDLLEDPTKFTTEAVCDIPCKFEVNMQGRERHIAGTEWKITQTMDDPYFSDLAKMERTAFRQDEYYSTTSLTSSVPLSSYSFELYNLRNRPAIDYDTAVNRATYVLDEKCTTSGTRRQKWFAAIEAAFKTAAYGSCHHNEDVGTGETVATQEGRISLAKKNRMYLAFEAGTDKDFMTEITWESLLSGAVPVILGASNTMDLLPKNSAVDAKSFNNWDTLATYVKQVSENKTLWESHHAWRNDETELAAFEARFNFTRSSVECRMCRWAYAKMYGLGWDHEQQVVKEPHLPRQLCLANDKKIVTKPFREVWVERGTKLGKEGGEESEETCKTMTSGATIEMDNYKVTRTVTQHDGVTDIMIISIETDSPDEDVVLRLQVDVRNTEGAFFRDTHTLVDTIRKPLVSSATVQDENSKVTVLANWETVVHSPEEGTIEIVIQQKGEAFNKDHSHRRIRVITEDISSVHDKMTEFFPSSFGKQMTKDFIDPVEMFYTD
jgi:hypothetical protein